MRNNYLQQCDFSSRFRILKGGKIALVVSAFIASVTMLQAAPSGGVVTSGSASIAQSGLVTNITQSSGKASINWTNFSIAAAETVNFNQPSVSAITLNRVIGNEKSIIDGALNANGQVWILNSNGVLFNSTANINTSGLLATTQSLSDADFQAGNYSFKGDSTASVINLGTIDISNGGYASLLANSVSNEGTIKAIKGTVTLTGASEATINLNGNSLVSLKVNKGVLDALVENKGAILADGGKVYLTTNAVDELLKGVVNNTGIIEAKTLDDISGEVILYAHGGTTNVSGVLNAEGGFIETSGDVLHVSKDVSIKAKEWLLDPTNITIAATGTEPISGNPATTTTAGDVTISTNTITSVLNGGTDVTLSATNDITINDYFVWYQKLLTLHAGRDINLNAYVYAGGGLTLNAVRDINFNNDVSSDSTLSANAGHDINVNAVISIADPSESIYHGALILTYGNALTMGMNTAKTDFVGHVVLFDNSTLSINNANYTIIRDTAALAALSSTGDMNGNYVLGGDLDMTGVSFTPIGYNLYYDSNAYAKDFTGNFNGLGNTVANLTISTDYNGDWRVYPDYRATGLFGTISGDAQISNMRLSNATVTNTAETATSNYNPTEVGALVGSARAQYDPTRYDQNNNYVFVAAPTLSNNIVTGSTITSDHGSSVGGIIGWARDRVVLSNNAVTSTTVTSSEGGYVGGIAGYAENYVTISNAYVADATITAGLGYVGGIAGDTYNNSLIDNAYVTGSTITASGTEGAGAITGRIERQSEVRDSYAGNNTISARRDAGGLVGIIEDFGYDDYEPSTITNSFYKLDDTSINGTLGVITYGGIYANQASAWLAGNKVNLSAATYLGAASGGFYTIDSAQDLNDMLGLVYNPANNFKLSTNLSLAEKWYLPVLTGIFDGNSYTLRGLNVTQDYNANIGFVGRLFGGTVQNLTIDGATLKGYENVGGIAGVMRGNTFVGTQYYGHFTDGATVTNAHVTGLNYNASQTFDATWNQINSNKGYINIGGLVGQAQGKSVISNSDSAGSITIDIKNDRSLGRVEAYHIGGLVGTAYGNDISLDQVSSSVGITLTATALSARESIYNETTDIKLGSVGGLVGNLGGSNPTLTNASATGDISVTTKNFYDDALSSMNSFYIGNVGGLVGYANNVDAITLSATNTIHVKGDDIQYIGGIIGYSYGGTYEGMTRTGAITINPADATTGQYSEVYYIGGLIGFAEDKSITHATAAGSITLGTIDAPLNYAEAVGGAVGYADAPNIDTTVSSVAIAATYVLEGYNFGGLVGKNMGYETTDYKYEYSPEILGETYEDRLAYSEVKKAAYLARADVSALLAQGYELSDDGFDYRMGSCYIDFVMRKSDVPFGNITNSSASGNVIAPNVSSVGGLVGYNLLDGDVGATITHAYASGEVKGFDNVGGLVGYNAGGNIATSYATGKVTGTGTNVGGLVGYNEGSDSQIWDYPFSESTPIYDTEAAAQAAMDVYVAAYVAAHPDYTQSYLDNKTFLNGVSGKYYYYSSMYYYKNVSVGTITDSYATGEVVGHGASNVGGLVGYNYNDDYTGATITNSYAAGAVNADDATNVGGLVGLNEDALITKSYYDKTNNGSATLSDTDYGKTTNELKTLASFSDDLDIEQDTELGFIYPKLVWKLNLDGKTYTKVWVIGQAPASEVETHEEPDVSHITNGTAILPPEMPNFTPPEQHFSHREEMVQLASIPMGDTPSQLVGMQEVRQMLQGGGSGEFRIPLGQNSLIQLVNGGVNLPSGIDQEFFMAQR